MVEAPFGGYKPSPWGEGGLQVQRTSANRMRWRRTKHSSMRTPHQSAARTASPRGEAFESRSNQSSPFTQGWLSPIIPPKIAENKRIWKNSEKNQRKIKGEGGILGKFTRKFRKTAESIDLFSNYVIASAGGVIYDMDNKKIIKKNNISMDDVRMVCSYNNEEVRDIEMGDLFYYHKYHTGLVPHY